MTLETLNRYSYIRSAIDAIEKEIQDLYNPVKSPNGRENIGGTRGGTPSDPTAKNGIEAGELREILESKQRELLSLSYEIERWLETVKDAEMESIIRWRFKLCMSWKATSLRVYGYPNPDRARKKVERFLKKSEMSEMSASSECYSKNGFKTNRDHSHD